MIRLGVVVGVLISWSAASRCQGAVLRVPEDHATILAAVDATVAGDSVLVAPGTWSDTDTRVVVINGQSRPITTAAFLKPGISVVSLDGPATTIIDVGSSATALVMTTAGPDSVFLNGFSVTGSFGVAVSQNAPLVLQSCWIVNNQSIGIDAYDADVVLRDCLVEGNEWSPTGTRLAAIFANRSKVELYNCTLRDNYFRAIYVRYNPSRVVMDGCWVSGHSGGGGARLETVHDLQVRNSWFVGNRGANGGGVSAHGNSIGRIEFCVFAHDSATNAGGVGTDGRVQISNNTFYACDAFFGSAIQVDGSDFASVNNNVLAHCTSVMGTVRRASGGNHPNTGCNIFWANTGGDFSSSGTWTPAATDIFADPRFCDHVNGDYTLHSSSPGAPGVTPACGPIGALGVGCGSVSVQPKSWGQIKESYR